MPFKRIAVVWVLVLVAPGALAEPVGSEAGPVEVSTSPPCIVLDISYPGPERLQAVYPEGCGPRTIDLVWNGGEFEGDGSLELRVGVGVPTPDFRCDRSVGNVAVDCSMLVMSVDPVEAFDASLGGMVRRWARPLLGIFAPEPSQPSPLGAVFRFDGPLVERSVLVTARFRAVWGSSDCSNSRGEFEAGVDGHVVSTAPPPGFLESLCELSRGSTPVSVPVEPQAAHVAAVVLGEISRVSRSVAPDLEPIRRELEILAPSRSVGAPPVPPSSSADLPETPASMPRHDVPTATLGAPSASVAPARSADPAAFGDLLVQATPADRTAEFAGNTGIEAGMRVEGGTRVAISNGPSRPSTPFDEAGFADEDAPTPAAWAPGPLPAKTGLDLRSSTTSRGPGADFTDPPAPPVVTVVRTRAADVEEPRATAAFAGAATSAIVAFLAVALYQRLARHSVLDHPGRRALHEACARETRSATAGHLARVVGIGPKAAEYHLFYLVRVGLLREGLGPTGRRVFASLASPHPPRTDALADRVLDLVRARPGVALRAIAETLGVTQNRVDRCAKRLLVEQRLEADWRDGTRVFHIPGQS